MVRRLTSLDYRAADILTDCYKGDPFTEWVMPNTSRWERVELYRQVVRAAIRMGVYVETTEWAVAISEPPGHRLRRMDRGPDEIRDLHNRIIDALPDEPFWHHTGLASKKKGHASILTQYRQERADRDGVLCIGYAGNPRSLTYYLEHHDYEVFAVVKTKTSPPITLIRREPQNWTTPLLDDGFQPHTDQNRKR